MKIRMLLAVCVASLASGAQAQEAELDPGVSAECTSEQSRTLIPYARVALETGHVVIRVDKVYVHPDFWGALEAPQKEVFTRAMGFYKNCVVLEQLDGWLPRDNDDVEIFDLRSARRLARVTLFGRFRMDA